MTFWWAIPWVLAAPFTVVGLVVVAAKARRVLHEMRLRWRFSGGVERLKLKLAERWPAIYVHVAGAGYHDDPETSWWVWLLDTPEDQLCEVEDLAYDVLDEAMMGDGLLFFLSAMSPEQTKQHFSEVVRDAT